MRWKREMVVNRNVHLRKRCWKGRTPSVRVKPSGCSNSSMTLSDTPAIQKNLKTKLLPDIKTRMASTMGMDEVAQDRCWRGGMGTQMLSSYWQLYLAAFALKEVRHGDHPAFDVNAVFIPHYKDDEISLLELGEHDERHSSQQEKWQAKLNGKSMTIRWPCMLHHRALKIKQFAMDRGGGWLRRFRPSLMKFNRWRRWIKWNRCANRHEGAFR